MTVRDPFGPRRAELAGGLSPVPDLKGGGRPVGVRACGRASLSITDRDGNWAAACAAWDEVRALIRRIAGEGQDEAWLLAVQAMRELRADVVQQFGSGPDDEKEVTGDVDQ